MRFGPSRRLFLGAVALIALAAFVASQAVSLWGADDPRAARASAAARDQLKVPDGKTPTLLAFISKMQKIKPPRNDSDDQKREFVIKAHEAIIEAAGKILDQTAAGKPRINAVKAKIESLVFLDEKAKVADAKKRLADFADELKDDKQAEVAKLLEPYAGLSAKLLAAEANKVAADDAKPGAGNANPAGGQPASPQPMLSWNEIKAKLAEAPDDRAVAIQGIKAVQTIEHFQGEAAAAKAYRELADLFAKSSDQAIVGQGKSFEGTIRRLSLLGQPMEISGDLLDGTPFDPATLKGKVVLIDFWATWCPPCREELPNVLANYEKYHAKGFEVVGISLDDANNKAGLEEFIEKQSIPWPIVFSTSNETSGWQNPMATYYGIHGIPTAILMNQKGQVVSLGARGMELTARLEQLLGK